MQSQNHRRSIWAALALLIAWLIIAGGLTWQRSRESVIPPVWDQKSYVMKAEAFWLEINAGKITNPLNIPPSSRPPGTICITAPTGPLKDFRNFYFRSTFVPVVLMVLAVFLAGFGVTKLAWPSALMAVSAGSLPMFWQFEVGSVHNTGYSWGLMDTFQAGLSAMAMAGLLVAAVGGSRWWTVPALIALGLVPLVKPSGFVLAGLISLAWLIMAIRFSEAANRKRKDRWNGIVTTSMMLIGLLGGLGLASLRSDYFSTANMEFGKTALAQLRSEWMRSDMLGDFVLLFTRSIGLPLIVSLLLLGGAVYLRRTISIADKDWKQQTKWAALIGIVILLLGLGLTYQATLFRQTRYFFPVLAISTVLLAPLLISWCWRAGARVCSLGLLIPSSLLLILATPRLSNLAYTLGSYGLFSGFGKLESDTTKQWLDQFLGKENQLPILFTTTDGPSSAAVEAVFAQRLKESGASDAAVLGSITRPFDWEKGGIVRISDIYNADLLVMDGTTSAAAKNGSHQISSSKPLTATSLDYKEELQAWKTWLAASTRSGSTTITLENPQMIALQIRDRSLLHQQMRQFLASRSWRPEFVAANKPSEFSSTEISRSQEQGQLLTEPVTFDNVLRLHGLAITRNNQRSPEITISAYTENRAKETSRRLQPSGRTFSLFIHQLDPRGKMLTSQIIPLRSSRIVGRPITHARAPLLLLPDTTHLGVGVYEPSANFVLPTNWIAAQAKHPLAEDGESGYWRGRRASFAVESIQINYNSAQKP